MKIPGFFSTKKARILLAVLLLLIAVRLALPYIVLRYANKTLSEMDGYRGRVNDIDIALLRGAYVIDSFYLNQVAEKTGRETEFLSARSIDLSLEWKALFSGKLAGELIFDRPVLRFTNDRVELDQVSKDTTDFRELLRDFMPVEVNRCEIQDGTLIYRDPGARPAVDLAITRLDALALNLRNAYRSNEVLPATLEARGEVYSGTMTLSMKLNPLAEHPTFDLNAGVEKTDLTKLNDMFKAYGGFDVSKGEFNMYAEAAAKEGRFTGYVKPIIRNLDVVEWQAQDKKDNIFQKIWESVVGGVGEIFENQPKDQLATKVNFSGDFNDPQVNIFQTIVIVLRNAFIQSLRPSIDNQINLAKVGEKKEDKGFFKELFGNGKDKDKRKRRKKD